MPSALQTPVRTSNMHKIYFLFLLVFLSGCVSSSPNSEPTWLVPKSESKDIQIYRPEGSHSRAIAVYFGSAENYVLGLDENQYAVLNIPYGEQTLRVQPNGSTDDSIQVVISRDTIQCFSIRANDAAWAAVAVPILAAGIPSFVIAEDKCLDSQEKENYTLIRSEL